MSRRTNTAKWLPNQKRWQINVQKDGKRRSFTSSTPGRTGQREANAKADAWLDDTIEDPSIKVNVLYNQYFESIRQTCQTSRQKQVQYFFSAWILPNIGHLKASRLNDQHLQDILNAAYSKGLSRFTLMALRSTIRQFLRFCRRVRATALTGEDLTIPKNAKVNTKHILSTEELHILFSSDKSIYYKREISDPLINAYRFQVVTGLRPGELLGLEWSDIKNDTIVINRSYNIYNETTRGKNQNANRTFVLTPIAKQLLSAQRRLCPFGRIFGNITQPHYRRSWKTYCVYNGIEDISVYELRHTFISMIKNLPISQIKSLVGHSYSMDTLGVYAHEVEGDAEEIAQSLQKVLSSFINTNVL